MLNVAVEDLFGLNGIIGRAWLGAISELLASALFYGLWALEKNQQLLDRMPHGVLKLTSTHVAAFPQAQNDPEEQAADPHLDDDTSISTFDFNDRQRCVKKAGDVLPAERSGSDAIALRKRLY